MSVEMNSDPSIQSNRDEEAYLKALLRQSEKQKIKVRSEIVGWLQELRQRAAYDVAQQQFPTRRDEEWRFTDLSEVLAVEFARSQPAAIPPEALEPFILSEAKHSRVVFVNGFYAPDLSDCSGLPEGAFVGNLAQLPLEKVTARSNTSPTKKGKKKSSPRSIPPDFPMSRLSGSSAI